MSQVRITKGFVAEGISNNRCSRWLGSRRLTDFGLLVLLALGLFPSTSIAQGILTNGWTHGGTISSVSDSDSWTFFANVGERIVVRAGEVTQTNSFTPRIRLLNSSSVQQGLSSGSVAAEIEVIATNGGTFTVIVDDANGTGTGTYRLTLAKLPGAFTNSPGDEGGTMTNGVTYEADLPIGDLDVWTFTANSGDGIAVGMGETVSNSTLYPYLRLYGPNGALLASNFGQAATGVSAQATNSGTFTVVAGNNENAVFGGNGTYRITLAQVPRVFLTSIGDEGGPLTNGITAAGIIQRGDLDMWSFGANGGDSLQLTLTNTSGNTAFYPAIALYRPDGILLQSTFGNFQSSVSAIAPRMGTYTVVASSQFQDGSGSYQLRLNKFPPDAGQSLTLGIAVTNQFRASGDRAYYVVNVPPGGHLRLTLDELDNLGANEIYVRRGSAPTAGLFDYKFTKSGADQMLLVP